MIKNKFKSSITAQVIKASNKTCKVKFAIMKTHNLYHKKYTIDKTRIVHDEKGQAKVGDKVIISPCRPRSAKKRWQINEVIK